MTDDRTTPERVVLDLLPSLPDGAYVTAAVVVVTYTVPGAVDDDDRGPFLKWGADGIAGRWTHLGMAETVAADCRRSLAASDMDDDG